MTELAYKIARGSNFKFNTMLQGNVVSVEPSFTYSTQ